MYSLLAQIGSPLMAQWSPLAVWNSIWPYLVMLLGFSLIIFIHEMGHFLVAKWADVRVEKFAIGFGREVLGFTRGETRYCLNILPLGGYVKMLGQEDFDDKAKELRFKKDPRSFVNKPVGRRMAIVSAGVVANVLFACLLFMIVFMIGMEAVGSRIAYVEPDSPAEKAGLLPGDEIQRINGKSVLEFNEVTAAVFLSRPHESIEFVVKREGGLEKVINVKPEYRLMEGTRQVRRQIIGIGPGVTREIIALGPEIDSTQPDQPHVGDRVVEVDGIPVTDENVSQMIDVLAYTDEPIYVERDDPDDPQAPPRRVKVTIPPQLLLYPSDSRDPSSTSILGLTPLVRFAQVDPRGRAHLAGIEAGDTVLRWDDLAYPDNAAVAGSIRDNPERDIAFELLKSDGRILRGAVRPKRHRRGAATVQAVCKPIRRESGDEGGPRARFGEVRPNGRADRAGIASGDAILQIGGVDNPSTTTVNRLIRQGRGKTLVLSVLKRDGNKFTTHLQPEAPGSIDAKHSLFADDVLQTGRIVPTINGKASPAAVAGIAAGVRLVAVNGRPIARWRELILAFRDNAGTTVDLAYLDQDNRRQVAPFGVPHDLRTLLGVGPEARILAIDGRETVTTTTKRGEEEVSVRYHQGTRVILTELIGRTQVPVEYRKNLLSPIRTKYIDVTADMVDPWLGRVAFSPNLRLKDETRLLKGANALDALLIGVHKTYYFVAQVYQIMHRMIFARSVSLDAMSGPLGIFSYGGQIVQAGTVHFLFFLAMLSANLAVINFLPLPIVDGGLMVFLLIEKIKGSPVSLSVQIATQMIGFFLIIGAFLFVTYNDAMRLWG